MKNLMCKCKFTGGLGRGGEGKGSGRLGCA